MHGLTAFKNGVAEILTDYENDTDMNYVSASTRLEIEIENFSVANAIDMPDEAMDEMFSAFAELQVKAFEKQHISEAEACYIIHDRAKSMFEDCRGWEVVEAVTQSYVDRIEGPDEAPPQQYSSKSQTFEGPFGHDIGLN